MSGGGGGEDGAAGARGPAGGRGGPALADILGDLWARKGAGLGAAERALHRAILRAFPDLGGLPGAAQLRGMAAALGLDAEAALAALHERDLVRRDPGSGAIVCA